MSRAQRTPGGAVTLARIAEPADLIGPLTLCAEVDRRFARDLDLGSLVVGTPDTGLLLVDRGEFQHLMTGPNGFGRTLYHENTIREVISPASTLVLPASTSVQHAYLALLRRDRRVRFRDIIVVDHDWVGVVSASVLLEQIAEHNASEALHDPLTGLPNRSLVLARIEEHLARPGTGALALLFIDLDRFKVLNDGLGHMAGDVLLERFAERLQQSVRAGELAARLGGDEFAILVTAPSARAAAVAARAAAERVHQFLYPPFSISQHDMTVSASIGIAVAKAGGQADDLLRHADIAMYQAKRAGGAQHRFFSGAQEEAALQRMELEIWLRRSLADDTLVLHAQPIIALDSGEIVGFETLIRGRHPERGLLAPSEFLLVAEETGLMPDLDRWVLYRSLLALRDWRNAPSHFTGYVSVNISAQSLDQPDLAEQIADTLRRLQLPAEALQVEITESSMVRDLAAAVQTVQRIQALGVRIAIDDFGTGYSSLTHLSRVPADVLKVDGTFVQRLDVSEQDAEIVRLVLALSRAMDVETVAEGIETAEQARLLRLLGCRFGQGFFFQRPVEARDASLLLSTARPIAPLEPSRAPVTTAA